MPGPLPVLFGARAVDAPHAPILTTVYIETSVSKHFLSNSHSVSHMLLITIQTLRRRPSFIKTKPSSLWELKNVTNYSHYVILTMKLPFTLFYSSLYSEYSYFFLKIPMKTGIGQSKYCIPQPFSHCLISLCRSIFDFNLRAWMAKKCRFKKKIRWAGPTQKRQDKRRDRRRVRGVVN